MRMLGRWQVPVAEEQAKTLISNGAKLVDVRSQNEYAKSSIEGAVNLPLEELEQHISEFKQGTCLLFCNSGTRSHIAIEKLKSLGISEHYNLGDLNRAKSVVAG